MNAQTRRAILEKVRIAEGITNPEVPYVACNPVDRQSLKDFFDMGKERNNLWGFCITMPCGCEKDFKSLEDIPFGDLPCPCRRADHFFIKYSLEPLGNELAHIS